MYAMVAFAFLPIAGKGQTMHFIRPSATDPAITNYDSFHIALASAIPRRRLLLFLPGSGAAPSQYQEIIRAGSSNGLHAIGLQYVNGDTVSAICLGDGDTNTHAKVREEIVFGTNTSARIEVDARNSVEGRLVSLLRYLTNTFPAEAWAQYLGESNNLVWSNIVAAGHSQGASHAAFIGKKRRLNRVVAIGNEADWVTGLGAAPWFSWPPETPASRFLCFTHTNDILLQQSATWDAMEITGTSLGVEFNEIPFEGSHRLTTGLEPTVGTNWLAYHSAPVVDLYTPRTNGVPILQHIWEWLLVGAVTLPRFSQAASTSGGFEVTFNAEYDVKYHMQTTTNLAASWEATEQFVTNLTGHVTARLTNASRVTFCRIMVEWK
jgi:hypothetical protein